MALSWDGPAVEARIVAELTRRLNACALIVCNHAKKLVNVEGTTTAGGGGRNSKGQFKKLVYRGAPSLPGQPPRKQTGRLLGSIAWEVVGLVARVGTNLPYGRELEFGIKRMAARPWLRRALAECRAVIKAILERPLV